MLEARRTFLENLRNARDQSGLYDFLVGTIIAPFPFDDVLRFQLAYSVSAFDKLIHDIIRIGMVETFVGRRIPTPKYLAETISIQQHSALAGATLPPAEFVFANIVARKLGAMSFQHPKKISDGLSLVWAETNKWDAIAVKLGAARGDVERRLILIADRRNAIVHQADMHPITSVRQSISRVTVNEATDFLERCGEAIVGLIV